MTTSDFSDSAVIVWPSEYPDSPQAHCTAFYFGDEVSTADFTREQIQDVLDALNLSPVGLVGVVGMEMFGEEKDIPVARVTSLHLTIQRSILVYALLDKAGIRDASEYAFNPHVSLDPTYGENTEGVPTEEELPDTISLGSPVLWWQGDNV